MIKLLLLVLLCVLGYYLARALRSSTSSRVGTKDHDEWQIDPSRAVDAQFEDVDQEQTPK